MDSLTPARIAARLRAGGRGRAAGDEPPRPEGRLLWVHHAEGVPPGPVAALIARLEDELGPVAALLTGPPDGGGGAVQPPLVHRAGPTDDPAAIERFLRHWRPDAGLWVGDCHDPLLLDAAAGRNMPLVLINAAEPPPETGRPWRVRRLLLNRFRHILALDAGAAESLRSYGLVRPQIEVTGPFTRLPEPLPCAETDREEFAAVLSNRPVWLAVAPPPEEMEAVLAAHRSALRGAHRLLLMVVPPEGADGAELAASMVAEGWSVARRGAEEMPDTATEIFVADSPEELGLWYRLAPLCFAGGTLTGGAARDPMEAATLGAAIVSGPEGGAHAEALDRLDDAGALRRIGDPDALGRAVADLLAPDRAAALAHRAWDVSTDGADVEERLVRILLDALRPGR